MHCRYIPALLLTLPACILDKSLGENLETTTTDPTGEPDPTGSDGGDEQGGATGVASECPEGQAPLAPLWQAAYTPPPDSFGFYSGRSRLGRLADGRLVAAGNFNPTSDERGVALVLLAPDGQVLGVQTAVIGEWGADVHELVITPDDQSLVLADHGTADDKIVVDLTRFAADMSLVSQVELPFLAVLGQWAPPTLALAPDGPVVAGKTSVSESILAKLAPGNGAPVWQRSIGPSGDLVVNKIAVGPAGDIALAAHSDINLDGDESLRLYRFDSTGAPIWERVLTVPAYERVTALHFAPGDQIVALRGTNEFSVSVEMVSVAVADGATRWELTVAEREDDMSTWAEDMQVDPDFFTIPVSRYPQHHDVETSMHSLEVRTVSFAGDLLDVTPVPGVFGLSGTSWVRSVRGRCGELVLVDEFSALEFMAFAP